MVGRFFYGVGTRQQAGDVIVEHDKLKNFEQLVEVAELEVKPKQGTQTFIMTLERRIYFPARGTSLAYAEGEPGGPVRSVHKGTKTGEDITTDVKKNSGLKLFLTAPRGGGYTISDNGGSYKLPVDGTFENLQKFDLKTHTPRGGTPVQDDDETPGLPRPGDERNADDKKVELLPAADDKKEELLPAGDYVCEEAQKDPPAGGAADQPKTATTKFTVAKGAKVTPGDASYKLTGDIKKVTMTVGEGAAEETMNYTIEKDGTTFVLKFGDATCKRAAGDGDDPSACSTGMIIATVCACVAVLVIVIVIVVVAGDAVDEEEEDDYDEEADVDGEPASVHRALKSGEALKSGGSSSRQSAGNRSLRSGEENA
jgi:hypothetical protein